MTKARNITGNRLSLDFTRLRNAFVESGFARTSLLDVSSEKALNRDESCIALIAVAPDAVDCSMGKAAGTSLKRSAAETVMTTVVRRLQKKEDSQTKPFPPFFLARDEVPAVIAKKTKGNTMNTPSFETMDAMKFTDE